MRRILVVVVLLGAWWWLRDDDRARDAGDNQAAVLRDGFAVRTGKTVVEFDRKGTKSKQYTLAHDGDARVFGMPSGTAAAWIEAKKIRLVRASTGKSLAVFGKSARMLCEGLATNDERHAVGWLEADGGIWFVHGDTKRKRTAELDAEALELDVMQVDATADRKNWCGVASAADLIALFWRDSDRLFIQTCTRKKCAGLAGAVAFKREDNLLGFGCVRDACLLAARDKAGKTRLQLVTESGSTKWTKPLDTTKLEVSIVGAGPDSFAVGYSSDRGSDVLRVDRKGTMTSIWNGAAASGAPSLAWSNNKLLVAPRGGEPTVVAFPR